jgi:hypothetical protein
MFDNFCARDFLIPALGTDALALSYLAASIVCSGNVCCYAAGTIQSLWKTLASHLFAVIDTSFVQTPSKLLYLSNDIAVLNRSRRHLTYKTRATHSATSGNSWQKPWDQICLEASQRQKVMMKPVATPHECLVDPKNGAPHHSTSFQRAIELE